MNVQGLTVGGNVQGLTVGSSTWMLPEHEQIPDLQLKYFHRHDPYRPYNGGWCPCGGIGCGCGGTTTSTTTKLAELFSTRTEPVLEFKLVDGKYTLLTELSGYDKKDVELKITENQLTIKAKNGGLEGKSSIEKKVAVPLKASLNDIEVSLEKGVLRIVMKSTAPAVLTITIP